MSDEMKCFNLSKKLPCFDYDNCLKIKKLSVFAT